MDSPKNPFSCIKRHFQRYKVSSTSFYFLRQKNGKNFTFLWDGPIKTHIPMQTNSIFKLFTAMKHTKNKPKQDTLLEFPSPV
jgi:hypothetical protein